MNHWIMMLGLSMVISCQPKEHKELIYIEEEKSKEITPEQGISVADGSSTESSFKLPDVVAESQKDKGASELNEPALHWQNAIQVRTEGIISGRIPLSKGELKFLKIIVKNRGDETVRLSLDEQKKFFVIEPFYYYFYISRIIVFQPIFLSAKFLVAQDGNPVERNGNVEFELKADQEVEIIAYSEMNTECQDYDLVQGTAKNLSEYLGILYGFTHEIHSILRVVSDQDVAIGLRDVHARKYPNLVMLNDIALNPGVSYDEPFRLFSRFSIDYYFEKSCKVTFDPKVPSR